MKYFKVNGGIIATQQNVDGEEIGKEAFEEIKAQLKNSASLKEESKEKIIPPTETERLEALEAALLELAEVLFNG